MRAEGEEESEESEESASMGDAGKMALTVIGGFAVVAVAYWAISTA